MGSPYNRRKRPTRRTFLMLGVEIIVLALAVYRFRSVIFPASQSPAQVSPTVPRGLTGRDVFPTPTPDLNIPPRIISFPSALMSAPIIPAGRIQGTWETRHLGDSVGHLVGTSWLDDPGGNIVLAGHVESANGAPGPFAYLFEAGEGDMVIIRDGLREEHYAVTSIDRAAPGDVSYVAQDGRNRLTLITCTDWDYETKTYLGRLVVIAEPVAVTAQKSQAGQ